MAYSTQYHKSIGYSPYEIVFGRKIETPLESDLFITGNTERYNDYVENLRSHLLEIKHFSRQCQSRSKVKQKKIYDKRTKIREYEVGQKVYLYLPQIKRHIVKEISALERHWSQLFASLYQYLLISNEIRELEQIIDEAKLRIMEFRQGLELVKTNRLSSKLFSPSDFLKVLASIEKLIPVELSLIVTTSIENVSMYYDIVSVQASCNLDQY